MLRQQEKHMKKRNAEHLMGPVATVFAAGKTGSWRLERPVVDYNSCIKCGTCERYCPSDIITIDKEAEECVRIGFEYCKDCITMVEEGGGENV